MKIFFFFFLSSSSSSSSFFFRAYGGCQAWVPIGATAAAYTPATAMQDPSHICDLHHSSHRQILNPLREARDWTHNLVVPSRIRFHCATMGTPKWGFSNSTNLIHIWHLAFYCKEETFPPSSFYLFIINIDSMISILFSRL